MHRTLNSRTDPSPYPTPEVVEFEATPALYDLPLVVTVEQLKVALEGHNNIIVKMPCMDFLELTTGSRGQLLEILMASPENPDIFNLYSMFGYALEMPALDVNLEYHTVVGHEGRHRAASVINCVGESKAKMYVSLKFWANKALKAKYRDVVDETGVPTRDLIAWEDVPDVIFSQKLAWKDKITMEWEVGSCEAVETEGWEPVFANRAELAAFLKTCPKGAL